VCCAALLRQFVGAGAIGAFEGFDGEAHLLADAAGDETADAVGLPRGRRHDVRQRGAVGALEHVEDDRLLAAVARRGRRVLCSGTINVPSTMGGFAAAYGILSIDDELIVYTAKTATQFTGCQRGAFGTVAASHLTGVPVKANMVSGFITALQSAVLAIENELGTAGLARSPLTAPPLLMATRPPTPSRR